MLWLDDSNLSYFLDYIYHKNFFFFNVQTWVIQTGDVVRLNERVYHQAKNVFHELFYETPQPIFIVTKCITFFLYTP